MSAKFAGSPENLIFGNEKDIPYSYEIISILPKKETNLQTPEYRDMLLVLSGRPSIVSIKDANKVHNLLLPIGKPFYVSTPYKINSMNGQARVLRIRFPKK